MKEKKEKQPEILSAEFNEAWNKAMENAFEQINQLTPQDLKAIKEKF
jgi:hypothetical protein